MTVAEFIKRLATLPANDLVVVETSPGECVEPSLTEVELAPSSSGRWVVHRASFPGARSVRGRLIQPSE